MKNNIYTTISIYLVPNGQKSNGLLKMNIKYTKYKIFFLLLYYIKNKGVAWLSSVRVSEMLG